MFASSSQRFRVRMCEQNPQLLSFTRNLRCKQTPFVASKREHEIPLTRHSCRRNGPGRVRSEIFYPLLCNTYTIFSPGREPRPSKLAHLDNLPSALPKPTSAFNDKYSYY